MKHLKHFLFLSLLCPLALNSCSVQKPATVKATENVAVEQKGINIGDAYQGGIIFHLFQEGDAGYVAGEVNGLVAAAQDQGYSNWNDAFSLVNNADTHNDAGKNFTDWRLPTKEELNQMYLQKGEIGIDNFDNNFYWSSTEYEYGLAWNQNFANGYPQYYGKINGFIVRAVRTF